MVFWTFSVTSILFFFYGGSQSTATVFFWPHGTVALNFHCDSLFFFNREPGTGNRERLQLCISPDIARVVVQYPPEGLRRAPFHGGLLRTNLSARRRANLEQGV